MRTAAFIDGQNLYHLARNAWSRNPSDQYGWPSYDVVRLAKKIARTQGRQLAFASAFPYHPGMPQRGVPGTTWIHIDKPLYDRCHDPTDYRL